MSALRDAMSHAALGWVKPELDETLRQARNEIEFFAEEPSDTSRMRFCAGYLHQVQGSLRMLELYAPAMVAEELEQLANAVQAGEVADRDEACAMLMRGTVLLPDYLERLQNGHRDIPIVLLPLLNEIRSIRGEPGLSESVLFAFDPDAGNATQQELEHARGSLSGRNRELLDTVGNAVKEELLRVKDALDLHLRTDGDAAELQTQVTDLGRVADTLGMMGLGVARNVVVQQRDALRRIVDGQQQVDEGLLLDIAGALLYVDASLDDQVASLGSGADEDASASANASEVRRTVEVLAHEAIANFAAAREHFVAFIETNWDHGRLTDVPHLLDEVAGAMRILDLPQPADYLEGVRRYVQHELIDKQRVPSGRQLDTLADAMASLEYYLEALRERRPGREDILDITRNSLETLRYWPLPSESPAAQDPVAASLADAGAVATATFGAGAGAAALAALSTAPAHAEAADEVAPEPIAPTWSIEIEPAAVPVAMPELAVEPVLEPAFDTALSFDPVAAEQDPSVPVADTAFAPVDLSVDGGQAPGNWSASLSASTPAFGSFDPVAAEQPASDAAEVTYTFDAGSLEGNESAPLSFEADSLAVEEVVELPPVAEFDAPIELVEAVEAAPAPADWSLADDAAQDAGDVTDADAAITFEAGDAPASLPEDDVAAQEAERATASPLALDAAPFVEEAIILEPVAEPEAPVAQADAPIVLEADSAALPPLPPIEFDTDTDADDSIVLESEAAPAAPDLDSPFVESADADAAADLDVAPSAPSGVHEAVIGKIELDDASAAFMAELEAAAAGFNTDTPVVAEPVAVEAAPVASEVESLPGGFEDDGNEIDSDIREVFLEEFDEELVNLGQLLPIWRAAPDSMDNLRPIRRVFHTLKGSGRLVGARTLGEFSWKIEGMLNRVLDGTRPASPAVVAMVEQAYEVLPQLNAALRDGSRIQADLLAMQAIADRVGSGEDAFYIPSAPAQSEVPAVPVAPVVEAAPVAAAAVVLEGTPASVDSVLREILEAEVATHLETVHAWLQAAQGGDQPVTEALLRAVHTMSGAFAMTDVPEITAVTTPAESYAKRALAAGLPATPEAVDGIAATAAAIATTIAALQGESPRIPSFAALAERLRALVATLPEAQWPPQHLLVEDAPEAIEALPVEAAAELTGADDLAPYLDPSALLPAAIAPTADLLHGATPPVADAPQAAPASDAPFARDAIPVADAGDSEVVAWSGDIEDAVLEHAPEAVVDATPVEDLPVFVESAPEDVAIADDEDSLSIDDGLVLEDLVATPAADDAVVIEATGADALVALEGEDADDLEAGFGELSLDAEGNAAFTDLDMPVAALSKGEAPADIAAFDAPLGLQELAEEVEEAAIAATYDGASDADQPQQVDYVEEAVTEEVLAEEVTAEDVVAVAAEPEAPAVAEADPIDRGPLDFNELDAELVDIFVEEGKDLLDHCDGLIAGMRETPDDREILIGLQRDLHTLKGGARMAGINAIGDLGHGIESLLEAVAANRTEIGRDDVRLLERGFDRLHRLLVLTGNHRAVEMPVDLVEAFDARTHGRTDAPVAPEQPIAAPARAKPAAELVAPAPLSAPVPVEAQAEEDFLPRAQQEQVRVRADLLDRLVNHAGEVAIYRSRLEQQLGAFRGAMGELDRTNARLRDQLRRLDLETEAQIVARYQREQDQGDTTFDPLELDRFSTLQQLSRALNESAADLGGLQGVLDDLARQYDGLLQQQSRVSSELQDGLMRARMVPFDGLVPRLRRVVRQAAGETAKQVHLSLEGTHGELDRNVLDRMVAPLEHMLRNSVAHGLELPEARRAAGKPEEGTIALRLRREGSEIVLEVSDDGAGLDREAIRRRGEQRGLIAPGEVLSDGELDNLIFASGFSTSEQVSQLAGRGVGMDVVRNEVRQLGGSVDIHSVRGQGTTFTLRLPQTLAVTQAVFVRIGETTFAVPVASVSGIGRIGRERYGAGEGGYHYAGEEYTLHDLGSLVGQGAATADGAAQVPLLLVRAGDLRAAVAIDQVLGNREIVVKPVGLQIASVPGIYGATITGDGRVVVILDVAPLVRRHLTQPTRPAVEIQAESQRHAPLVMVVDDSLTMRKVTGRVLERHNLEVVVARDGVEALERLEERVPDLMLLDIEMPRMDGYELATAMRADPRYKDVPIVMITSRSGEKHRQRAFEIGVQRYLGKPYQELDLMRNVYDLLGIARVRE